MPEKKETDFVDSLQKAHEDEVRYEMLERAKARVPDDVQSIERTVLSLQQTADDIAGSVEHQGIDIRDSLRLIESVTRGHLREITSQLRYLGALLLAILFLLGYIAMK
ncbi:hypothetical protein D3C86_1701220 [compost metagenome]